MRTIAGAGRERAPKIIFLSLSKKKNYEILRFAQNDSNANIMLVPSPLPLYLWERGVNCEALTGGVKADF